MMETQPIQSLHIERSNPKRSLGLIFQFSMAIFNSQPSGIKPSKKGNNILLSKADFCKGNVKLTGLGFELSRY